MIPKGFSSLDGPDSVILNHARWSTLSHKLSSTKTECVTSVALLHKFIKLLLQGLEVTVSNPMGSHCRPRETQAFANEH